MDDEKRKSALGNVSEDVAQLLLEECVEIGRLKMYKEVFDEPRWSSWSYADEPPASVEEYALGDGEGTRGTLNDRKLPDYASRLAVVDFFRAELTADFERCVRDIDERKGSDGE